MNDKMKILMITNFSPLDKSIGITKKIFGEIQAFRRKGYIVYYTAYVENAIAIFDNEDKIVYKSKEKYRNTRIVSITRRFELIRESIYFLNKFKIKFDIVFLRYLGFDYPYIKLLKTIKKKNGSYIIVDMLGYFTGIKSKNLKSLYMNISTKIWSKRAILYIDTLLAEGEERQLFGRETRKAYMGVDIAEFAPHIYKGDFNEINMISVANETVYHGYDRLVKSLALYKRDRNNIPIKLHLVGEISDRTKSLIASENVQDIVFLYGKKYGQELIDIYNKCNLGVGPLGQHRIGGKKDTGLKTKEYFAIGLPYFYAGEESTVPENYPYILQVPSDESILDFNKIIQFYLSYRRDNEVTQNMRDFAREYYSWDKIIETFLEPYYETYRRR